MQNESSEFGERSPEAKAALEAMRERIAGRKGKLLWKSYEELAGTEEFKIWVEDEFPNRSTLLNVDRRTFLTLSGAAMAMAGLTGCRILPHEKVVPYVRAPEDLIPGKPLLYATTVSRRGYGVGAIVECNEGRPTKLEGNPRHPASLGSTLVWEQAETLNLYDPDRSQSVVSRNAPGEENDLAETTAWDTFLGVARKALVDRAVAGGAGLALLTDTITSPTLTAQIQTLLKHYPQAKWYAYEPVGRENVHEGARLAFGRPLNPVYRLRGAKVVVSLDSNFLTEMPGSIRYARDYSDGRRVRKSRPTMNRLYAIESAYTVAGANADHRLSVKPSQIEAVARALYARIVGGGGGTGTPNDKFLDAIVSDIKANPGASVVIPGDQCSAAVHALANAINAAVGAVGSTVVYTAPVEAQPLDHTASLKALTDAMNAGDVKMLVILGSNPAYTAPADFKFVDALKRVPLRIRLGLYEDETSALCHWHLPEAHSFEAWGDLRAFDGTTSIIQPMIAPLYDGKSAIEFVAELIGAPRPGYEIVRSQWASAAGKGDLDVWWESVLNEGVVPNTALAAIAVSARTGLDTALPTAPQGGKMEINFRPDPHLFDGRYANNSWLQELPKPITTIVWDNVALIGPATAKSIGLIAADTDNDAVDVAQFNGKKVVKLSVGGANLEMPVWILPGQPADTVTVHLGFGRTRSGMVGTNIGFNTYKLRTSATMGYAPSLDISPTDFTYTVSSTQPHHMLHSTDTNFFNGKMAEVKNRDIVRAGTIQEYVEKNGAIFEEEEVPHAPEATGFGTEDPEHGKGSGYHNPDGSLGGVKNMSAHDQAANGEIAADSYRQQWRYTDQSSSNREGWPSLYPEFSDKGFNAWAMSIDLTVCTGCNTCAIACQAENNIPTVGKEQVGRGREMHWIRIDHYFATDEHLENPESYFQPVACVHCEKAPCEPVCPVAATIHNHEGLNQMIYNRCIGTRYCSNNCPYKVRRFNYLKWTQGVGGPTTLDYFHKPQLQMLANPDVTIRGRGVMEKCTYCVQRINTRRIEAKKAGREIQDGEIITACQQACPTNAIVFGDINNPNSMVSRLRNEPHDYSLLADLNTRPRTTYLARLRNPNPELEPPAGPKQAPAVGNESKG